MFKIENSSPFLITTWPPTLRKFRGGRIAKKITLYDDGNDYDDDDVYSGKVAIYVVDVDAAADRNATASSQMRESSQRGRDNFWELPLDCCKRESTHLILGTCTNNIIIWRKKTAWQTIAQKSLGRGGVDERKHFPCRFIALFLVLSDGNRADFTLSELDGRKRGGARCYLNCSILEVLMYFAPDYVGWTLQKSKRSVPPIHCNILGIIRWTHGLPPGSWREGTL